MEGKTNFWSNVDIQKTCLWQSFRIDVYYQQPYTLFDKGGWFFEDIFLNYLDICYVKTTYHKLKAFILLVPVNQSEASNNCFRKTCLICG